MEFLSAEVGHPSWKSQEYAFEQLCGFLKKHDVYFNEIEIFNEKVQYSCKILWATRNFVVKITNDEGMILVCPNSPPLDIEAKNDVNNSYDNGKDYSSVGDTPVSKRKQRLFYIKGD